MEGGFMPIKYTGNVIRNHQRRETMNIQGFSDYAVSLINVNGGQNAKVTKEEAEYTDAKEIKNSRQCYQDLCKRYPNAAFIVISDKIGTINESYSQLGACDLSHFGYPGQLSFQIPEQVLDKMTDNPDYADRVYSQIQSMIYNYKSITSDTMDAGMNYVCVQMEDIDEVDRYHLPFKTIASRGKMNACINSGKINEDFLQEKLKKISYFSEMKYNEMLEQFFQRREKRLHGN